MLRLLTKYWWLLVLRGAIAVLFGVAAYLVPEATLAALVIAFGAYALTDGVFTAAAAIAGRKTTSDWWVLLVQGLVGIGLGAVTLLRPGVTAMALLIYIAVWAIAIGMLQVYAAFRLRHEVTGEWWLALGGTVGMLFGALLLWRPLEGAVALLWMIAFFAILWGILLIVGGINVLRLHRHAAAAV
jgi:uncharacterized membrane protein HdeD (DUF308 family)